MRLLEIVFLIQIFLITHAESKNVSNLANAVQEIVKKLIEKNNMVFDFIEVVDNTKDGKLIDLQAEILKDIPRTISLRLDHFRLIKSARMRVRRMIFIYLESIDLFFEFREGIVTNMFDFYGYFIFIIYKDFEDDAQVIFDEMWRKYIYNVYVVCESEDVINLMTFLPFANTTNCSDITARVVNKFINGKFINSPILMSKLGNFNKCPLRVTTFMDEGNVMKKRLGNGSYEFYGQCLDFMNAVAESLNFKPILDLVEYDNPWGEVLENGTAMGICGKILRKETDIVFGDWNLKPSRTKYFDTTTSHGFNYLVFVVPPGQSFTPLEKLLKPYHWIVWTLLSVTFAIGLLVILAINYKLKQLKSFVFGRNVAHPIINMVIAILGLQQTVLPRRNFARFILTMFLILCLVMRSIYQGALFDFLQSDRRQKEIRSLKGLNKSHFTLYTNPIHEDLIKASMPEYWAQMQFYTPQNSFLVHELKSSDKKAGLENLKNIIFASRKNRSKEFHYCKEAFISVGLVWYLPRNSFLIKHLNSKIEIFISGGFLQHWVRKYYSYENIKVNERKLQKLNLTQLSGIFLILVFGTFSALLAFAFEIIAHKMMHRGRN